MATFNDVEKISLKQLNPELVDLLLNAITKTDFENHVDDIIIHLTEENIENWKIILKNIVPKGDRGQVYLINENSGNSVTPDFILRIEEFVITTNDLNNAKLVDPKPEYIYDIANNNMYKYNGSAYVIDTTITRKDFIGRLLYNPRTKKAFIINKDETIIEFILYSDMVEEVLDLTLLKANNLSDLQNVSQARTNLELVNEVSTHYHNDKYFTRTELLNGNNNLGISINNIKANSNRRVVTNAQIVIWDLKATKEYLSNSIEAFYDQLKTDITTPGPSGHNEIKDYIDTGDFLNFPPKVGFFEDDKYVPIYATYNMSYVSQWGRPSTICTDNSGREILYFRGSNGVDEGKLYRATRLNDSGEFIYENTALHPPYMTSSQYPIQCLGLGNKYISYTCYFDGTTKYHLVLTDGKDYTKWETYKDITSVILSLVSSVDTINSVMYFEDYNTIGVVYFRGQIITFNLYDYDTLTLITTKQIADYSTLIDYEEYTYYTETYVHNGGATYNETTEQLVVIMPKSVILTNIATGGRVESLRTIIHIISAPKTFFEAGQGEFVSQIPDSEYKWGTLAGKAISTKYLFGYWTVTYDAYESCIRSCFKKRDTYYDTLWRVNDYNRPLSAEYLFNAYSDYKVLMPPDTSPWAKMLYSSSIMENNLYLYCVSNKYGALRCCAEYYTEPPETRLRVTAGKWWLSSEKEPTMSTESRYYACQRLDSTTTLWSVVVPGQDVHKVEFNEFVNEDGVTLKGVRSLGDPIGYVPEVPSEYVQYGGACCYNVNTRKAYYVVYDKVSADPDRQGFAFILEYDENNDMFIDHRNMCDKWESTLNTSKASRVTSATGVTASNMFIDVDNTIYTMFSPSMVSGELGTFLYRMIPQSDGTIIQEYGGLNTARYPGVHSIGWSSNFGYSFSYNGSFTKAIFATSKDYINGGVEKTVDQWFSGNFYNMYVGLAPSIGLICYMQTTSIFLGGYYTELEPREIYLKDNSDNYVYLVRDRSDRSVIHVRVREKPLGVPGENAFNRILASKIVTKNGFIISQVDYKIE